MGFTGLGAWGLKSLGMDDSLVAAAAASAVNLICNRATSAADKNEEDRQWWANLLANEDIAKGMATAIQRVISDVAERDQKLPRRDLAVAMAPAAYERWVELSKQGAPFIAELQDSAVLEPLALQMSGVHPEALDPGAWRAFLLSLIDEESERADLVVQRLAGYLAGILHTKVIPAFLDVVAMDLKSGGALYAKITLRFQGATYQNTEEIKAMVRRLLTREPPAATPPFQLPTAASRYFGRAALIADLEGRLRRQKRTEVWGGPGMGKTALAAEAVGRIVGDDPAALAGSPFPQGVVFLDLYRSKDLDTAWNALANAFDDSLPTDMKAVDRAAKGCAHRRALIILEGAEELGTRLQDFITVLAPASTLLVLTREEAQTAAGRRLRLDDLLEDGDAFALLRHLAGAAVPGAILTTVQARLGGHPLALTWAGSQLSDATQPPAHFLRDLEAEPFTKLTEPGGDSGHTLRWMFDRSVRLLADSTRTVLAAVARLSEPFEESWAVAAGGAESDLQRLVQLSFLRLSSEPPGWQFAHALAAQYARALPLPEGLLAKLGHHALAGLTAADARCLAEGNAPLGLALAHATALLGHDAGSRALGFVAHALIYHHEGDTIGIRRGRLDFARSAAGAGRAWQEQAPAEQKATPGWQHERWAISSKLGDLAVAQGDLAGALRSFTESKTIRERLAASDPANAEWQRDLSYSCWVIAANVFQPQQRWAEALELMEQSLRIDERLAATDPTNVTWQEDVKVSRALVAELRVKAGGAS